MKLSRFFLAIVLAGLTTKMSHAQQPTANCVLENRVHA
jgi:hypothetical protein